MKPERRTSVLRVALCIAATLAFVSAHASAASAQTSDAANQESFNRRDLRDRESALRTTVKSAPFGRTPEQQRMALAQIKEDYERIQHANNELLRTLGARHAATPDYKLVASVAAEIRRRADRLKTNLAFPEADEKAGAQKHDSAKAGAGVALQPALKDSLIRLDRLIVSFVTNPIFRSRTNVVDAQLAARASLDLAHIIRLTADIKKTADRLNKTAPQSP